MSEKYYQISTYDAEGFETVHDLLCNADTSDEHIPQRSVECTDHKPHSPTRGVFLLTDEEADQIKHHSAVEFIHIDYSSYPEQYKPNPDDIVATPVAFFNRYSGTVKNYRDFENVNALPATPQVSDLNRTGFQLLRCTQEEEPWLIQGQGDFTPIESNIRQQGSGKDVDVVVSDDGCWFGHPEFQNNQTYRSNPTVSAPKPNGYIGGNPLPGEGTCDLLDLVLDSPYYIDPDYFNSDSENLLETRWDGTIVPTETAALNWWALGSNRSVKFANIGTVDLRFSGYTRARNNGSNLARSTYGRHGTPCAALTYGRTQGWAYNANKWFVQSLNFAGTDIEPYFDILKLFHLHKPVNTKYGTQDPTIASNSWGYRESTKSGSYYTFRGTTSSYAGYTNEPPFIAHMGQTGDIGRWSGEMKDNSYTQAGKELVDSGVIFVAAAGNSNQKQVTPDHPDFNNYIHDGLNDTLTQTTYFEFGLPVYGTTNRRGFPTQMGKTLQYDYPVIAVGALDDDFINDGALKEKKVNYSNRGNTVDCYAPADGTLAANHSYSAEGIYPATYPEYNKSVFDDKGFSGICSSNSILANLTPIPLFTYTINTNTFEIDNSTPYDPEPSWSNFGSDWDSGDGNGGYKGWTIPWEVEFNGSTYTEIFLNTNSVVTFGQASSNSNISAVSPALPKIAISAGDGDGQLTASSWRDLTLGTSPNREFTISGTFVLVNASSTGFVTWQMKFFENDPQRIDLIVVNNDRIASIGDAPASPTDCAFGGTSAACPVASGFLATVLEHNRNWTSYQLKDYMQSLNAQPSDKFYYGTETTTATSSNWYDYESLEGGSPQVLYQGTIEKSTFPLVPRTKTIRGPLNLKGGANLRYK